jgi:aminoglycoside phosphotransferase (APT) family kinase protein
MTANRVDEAPWAPEALARINAATGRAYRLTEHRSPPHPNRPESGVWVVADGDHRACLKRLPGDTALDGQRAAQVTCERLHAAGSPVPRYHVVDDVAGDGYALMDFMPGHPVALGSLTAGHARHLVDLIELQADAAVLPPTPSDTAVEQLVDGILRWRLPDASPRVTRLLQRAHAIAEESRGVRVPSGDVLHGDMNPSNFIVDAADGDRITGIVDWEGTTTGDRAADLAGLLYYQWEKEAAPVLWDHLVAITSDDARRMYLAGWACPALFTGAVDRATAMLDRAAG